MPSDARPLASNPGGSGPDSTGPEPELSLPAPKLWRPIRVLITPAALGFAHGCSSAVEGVPRLDLSVELITHRFTLGSKRVLMDWYKGSSLDMNEAARSRKRTKFGSLKYVYPADLMHQMRAFFEEAVSAHLPSARILYWT